MVNLVLLFTLFYFTLGFPRFNKRAIFQQPPFGPFHGSVYQGLKSVKKASLIWQALNYNQTSLNWYTATQIAEIFIEDMNLSFDTVADDMPCQFFCTQERKKLIHTVGVLAQGKFVVKNNPKNYSGLFQTGAETIIIRLSLASEPVPEANGDVVFLPGVVIKYLRDNVPSSNTFAMYSLLGQNSYNFFKHDLSNHVPSFGSWAGLPQRLLFQKFLQASQWPTMIGLYDFALYDEVGKFYPNTTFPYRIVFHPTEKWHNFFSDSNPGVPFNEHLVKSLTPGPLYEVYVQDRPPFTDNSQLYHLGTIEMTSAPSLSHYGDRSLFMQHYKMESDLNINPDWVSGALQDLDTQQNTPAPGYTYPDLPWTSV